MRYWLRELAGWGLIVLSLLAFVLVIELCLERRVVEPWPIALIAIFVFRGGIHLLKVAIAARICQQAQDRLYPEATAPGDGPGRPGAVRPVRIPRAGHGGPR
jgi:hypothetical protein